MSAPTSNGLSLVYLRDVVRVLVARDFKLRYKRSLLGFAWTLLVPLAELAVLNYVFRNILRLNIPHYTSYLMAGILPWIWFQSALLSSTMTIVGNRDLVKQAGFPVAVLPAVGVLSHLVHFLLALPILAGFLLWDGLRPGAPLLALPVLILLQFLLSLSLSYIMATLQVRFRDTQYLLGILLFLFFYLTPVFWDSSRMPEEFRVYCRLNPVASLLDGYRSILLRSEWPPVTPMLTLVLVSLVVLCIGVVLYSRARARFVEEI